MRLLFFIFYAIVIFHFVNDLFSLIKTWVNNIWGNAESISGDGSTIDYTSSIRKHLPKLITELKVKNIFDAGCGDYNWFKEIDIPKELNYTGADIVEELIVDLKDKYEQKNINSAFHKHCLPTWMDDLSK